LIIGKLLLDRYQIGLASAGLLPTTSLRLAIISKHFVAVNRICGEARVPRRVRMLTLEIAMDGNTVARRTPVSPVRSLI
jgi:hypothetical protein